MRLQQLALRVHGDGARLRFSNRLTVIGGLSRRDRQGLVEVLLGTLAGEPTVASELAYIDRTGRRVVVDQTAEGAFHVSYDDGNLALAPSTTLGLSVHELFELVYLDAGRLGLEPQGPVEPRELAEARAALAALNDQLEAAKVARDAADALRMELVGIEREISQIETGRPRRRYAQLLVELEALRSERAALSAGADDCAVDSAVAAHAAELRPLAHRWREADRRRAEAARQFGDRDRLDEHALAGGLALPDKAPLNLERLVDVLAGAEARRASASARLAGLMAEHVPAPSHPDIARLARHDQDLVWAAADRAVRSALALERASVLAGGMVVADDDDTPAIVQEIEYAHQAVEKAQELLEKRRFGIVAAGGAAALGAMALPLAPVVAPLALAGAASAAWWSLIGPRQLLAEAQGWEEDALVRAGIPSYLIFHLRRMEAAADPALRAQLEQAHAEHRAGMGEWRRLSGDLSPLEALELEPEVRAYAAAVAALDELSQEAQHLRSMLLEEIEPAVESAREELMEVCRPFGIETPTLAADLIHQLVDLAHRARLQHGLEQAEAEEAAARGPVEDHLDRLQAPAGPTAIRLDAFEAWAVAAEERTRARARRRPAEEIDAEIARLEALSLAEHRPEYGTVFTAADAREPDREELEARRSMTRTAYNTARRLVPDVEKIADRRAAVERRVALLEAGHDEELGGVPSPEKVTLIERELQERLARLRHCGAAAEGLPLLLDEAFVHLRPDVKWRFLDLIDRLSAGAQVLYLSEDPGVATWARRRASAGSIAYLDPVNEARLAAARADTMAAAAGGA